MKILITGASGLLGRELVRVLLEEGHQIIAVYNRNPLPVKHLSLRKARLDITNTLALEDLILKEKPDTIIHAAAYTDVDGCETNKRRAWKVNVEATRSIVRAARVVKAYLVYISTDYVFDGEKGMYKEEDIPNPINYYGLTKLVAEEIVKISDILYTIIRTSAVYGVGGSKKSFAEFVAEKLSRGEKVYALTDQYVSPTLNTLLAKAITEIIEITPTGIIHVAGERMSRHEFAIRVAKTLNLPADLIEKISMREITKQWIASRPRDSSLDTSKAKQLLKTRFYDMNLALEIFKERWLAERGDSRTTKKL